MALVPKLPPPSGFGFYSRTYQSTLGGRTSVVTWGFQNLLAGTAGSVIGAVRTAWTQSGGLGDPAVYSANYVAIEDYCLVNLSGSLSSSAATFSVPGTGAWPSPPPAVSAVIAKRTDFAGKQYRGRMSLPACHLDEGLVDDEGNITGERARLQTAANDWKAAAAAANVPIALLHQTPKAGGPPPVPTPITQLIVSQFCGTQRKRQQRR